MITKERTLTIADWKAMPHGDGNRYEIIEGELFVSDWPGLTHQTVLTNLFFQIACFLKDNPVGTVVHNPPLILGNFTAVLPDLVFFFNDQEDTIINDDRLTGPPALVIEIVESGLANIQRDCDSKFKLYSKYAVPEYFIVYPKNMTVEQYLRQGDSLTRAHTVRRDDILTSEALPNFSCQVSKIFRQFLKG